VPGAASVCAGPVTSESEAERVAAVGGAAVELVGAHAAKQKMIRGNNNL
jgi:hypothetical protein